MTKQLYEEALADVRKVKEIAEANAQRAVLEAVTPRIRDLIERELLREHMEDGDEGVDLPHSPMANSDGDIEQDSEAVSVAITPPDEEGKVTLDLDALCSDEAGAEVPPPVMGAPVPGEEYEISLESVNALKPVLSATKAGLAKEFELSVYRMGDSVKKFCAASKIIKESASFQKQIAQMISRVEDMYDYVQESVTDSYMKSSYETKLEGYFKELNNLQETTMSQKTKKMMTEEDVTLKLTGLPDDIDLDSVGVDLITGEEGEEGEELDNDDLGGDEEGTGDDMGGDLDFGGNDQGGQGQMESRRLSDDTIVEIDESMLRREIARMRKLREEKAPSVDGHGVSANVMDDFGGGKDEGEPLDAEIVDKSPAKAALPLGESDGDLDEGDQMDEGDDEEKMEESLDELGLKRKEEERGRDEANHHSVKAEALVRKAAFEKRLQENAKSRAAQLKKEAARTKDARKLAVLKSEYATVAKKFNESLDRSKKISKLMLQIESAQNGGSSRPAESKVEASLRNKLAETNLINAKLLFTNKLLQNESLTNRQKSQVIEQLDSAKTVREAKLVYESLAKALAGKTVNENRDRAVIGSGSRATRPASTQTLNEGYEADRWARLAGIVK